MLHYYASRFSTVEINNTFYRLPSADVLRNWKEQVPASFTFVLKASRRITHLKRLKDAADPLSYLIGSSESLGPARGPFLFQLPPNLAKDLPRLTGFLQLLPDGVRAAFEFRHASWFDDDVYGALRHHGAALCVADTEDRTTPLVPTADWGYVRLRREAYPEADLEGWAGRIAEQPWSEAFTFFKHEDAGTGPRLAARFEEIVRAP